MVNRLVIVYSLYHYIFKNRAKPPEVELDPDHASPNPALDPVNGLLKQVKPAAYPFPENLQRFSIALRSPENPSGSSGNLQATGLVFERILRK